LSVAEFVVAILTNHHCWYFIWSCLQWENWVNFVTVSVCLVFKCHIIFDGFIPALVSTSEQDKHCGLSSSFGSVLMKPTFRLDTLYWEFRHLSLMHIFATGLTAISVIIWIWTTDDRDREMNIQEEFYISYIYQLSSACNGKDIINYCD
jgi:hypothetical protein